MILYKLYHYLAWASAGALLGAGLAMVQNGSAPITGTALFSLGFVQTVVNLITLVKVHRQAKALASQQTTK